MTGPIGMLKKLNPNPRITAQSGGKRVIFLTAAFAVPPNFIIRTKDSIKKMHKVAISQNIALKKPSCPKMPKVTGYPMKAVFAIITVTRTLHKVMSSSFNCFRMKYETTPVTSEEARIMKGKIPNFERSDRSAEYIA
jgi:hypothetical protein